MSDNVDTRGQGFLSSALLVAAVSGILLTGFLLKSDAPGPASHPAAASLPSSPALGSPIAPEPQPQTQPDLQAVASSPPAEPERDPKPAAPAPRVETLPAPAKPVAAFQPPPAADPLVVRLAERAGRDQGRLAKVTGRFTAQLIVACKPETVDRLLATGGSSQKLYVLPAQVNDEPCFRVCFGAYGSSKEAAAAADLPKALRGKEKIGAVEIAKVLL